MTSGVQTEGSGQGSSFDSNTQPVVTPSGQSDVDNCTDEELDRALAAAEAKRLIQKKRDRLTALLRGEDPDEQPADTSARPGKRLRESTWWKPSMSTLRYKASSWAELKVFTFEVKNRCAIDSSNTETEVDSIRPEAAELFGGLRDVGSGVAPTLARAISGRTSTGPAGPRYDPPDRIQWDAKDPRRTCWRSEAGGDPITRQQPRSSQ
ncbi:uncharacterized protein BCR38DRAFT_497286 [Pseudomassariella vexata]|uniref:Uncharacterized protein n=1 Tax=Pseudomassariella vexata TaxID=1141098 RepID=A0A1Y2DL04_9PEZI|nr:uncharacterized protein BCR38DRAFT_497286 [Pseudomassariella vexata]ORY59922.1 hypothetical protein BCR38DRAFT_497286 [Pseudomassariella vexata]